MTLSHVRSGDGEPLLLIHGIGDSHRAWGPVTGRLVADGFDVVAIDVPGFGDSAPLPAGERPNVAALTTAIEAFCDSLGWDRPHVGGNSMGGAIALELGARGRAASVTAISPAGFWDDRERRFCQQSLTLAYRLVRAAGPLVDRLVEVAPGKLLVAGQIVARPWTISADDLRLLVAGVAGSDAFPATLAAFDDLVPPAADQLDGVPVTIAWGSRDRLLLPVQAERARARLPAAYHVRLPGLGHVPMWDDPATVARVLAAGARQPAGV